MVRREIKITTFTFLLRSGGVVAFLRSAYLMFLLASWHSYSFVPKSLCSLTLRHLWQSDKDVT